MRILFTIAVFLIIACEQTKSTNELVKEHVEQLLMDNMDDPESYEFVEITAVDTILYIDNINGRRLEWERSAIRHEGDAATQERYKKDLPSMHSEGKMKVALSSSKQARSMVSKIDSIKNTLGDSVNNVASYSYIFKFRANNRMGAKILSEQFVQTDNRLNIINITDNKDDVVVYPNNFPGYDELIR